MEKKCSHLDLTWDWALGDFVCNLCGEVVRFVKKREQKRMREESGDGYESWDDRYRRVNSRNKKHWH